MPSGDPAAEAPAPDALALAVGDVVAERYRIDALLGQGGMGAVYRAEHLHLRKTLALKVLLPEWSSMPEVVARFEREAIAASNIQSPHVVAATDFGRLPSGSFFLVMEFVAGGTLRSLLDAGALETGRALRITRGIVSGLQAAHSLGIVHRDMKPENVMLIERDGDPDFVKLLDFGIAKVSGFDAGGEGGASGALTRVGAVIGTPDYMAPEQAMGQAIDARTDLYSVGVILFEMLAGKRPFAGEAVTVLRQHVLAEVPELPAAAPSNASPRIAAMVRRLLAKDVANRFASATELLEAIDGCLGDVRPPLAATAATELLRDPLASLRSSPRARLLVAGAVGVLAVVLLVALLAGRSGSESAQTAPGTTGAATASVTPTATPAPAPPASSTTARADDVPAAAVLPPPPAPSASSSSPAPGGAGSTPSTSRGDHRAATQPKSRKTGPGGIYIPPPSEWFK